MQGVNLDIAGLYQNYAVVNFWNNEENITMKKNYNEKNITWKTWKKI